MNKLTMILAIGFFATAYYIYQDLSDQFSITTDYIANVDSRCDYKVSRLRDQLEGRVGDLERELDTIRFLGK